MNYHTLSLVELKNLAKNHNPPIKHYYIKSRIDLIRLLTMDKLPDSFVLEKKTIAQLRKEARDRGYTNIWKFKKVELLELLYPSPKEDNHNHNHTEKHNDPQESKSK